MKTYLSFVLILGLLCAVAYAKPHNDAKRSHLTKRLREHELSNRMGHGDHHRREHSLAHKPETHRGEAHRGAAGTGGGAAVHKTEARKGAVHRGGGGGGDAHDDLKKELHMQHITEHNIEKKNEDKKQQKLEVTTKKHLVTNRVPQGEDSPVHLLTNRTPQVSVKLNTSDHQQATSKSKNGSKDGIPMESERLIHVTPRPPKVHKVNKSHHRPSPTAAAAAADTAAASSAPAHTPSTKAKVHKPPKKYSPKKHGWKKSLRKEKGKDKAKEKRERRDKRNKAIHRAIIARKL